VVQLATISSCIADQAAVGQDQGGDVDRAKRWVTGFDAIHDRSTPTTISPHHCGERWIEAQNAQYRHVAFASWYYRAGSRPHLLEVSDRLELTKQ
jgi:hypothetical protein